jgi:hypothetical protein
MRHIRTFEAHCATQAQDQVNEELTKRDIKAMALSAAMSLGGAGAGGKTFTGASDKAGPAPIEHKLKKAPGQEFPEDAISWEDAEMLTQLPKDTQKQLDWLRKYVMSDMYLKRLRKEFPGKSEAFIMKERQARHDNLKDIEFRTKFLNSIGSRPGMTSGVYDPKVSTGERKIKSKHDFGGSIPPIYYWKKTKDMPSPAGSRPGHVAFELEYGPGSKKPAQGFEHIPAHEYSHAVDDGGARIPDNTIDKIAKLTKPYDGVPFWRKGEGGHEFEYNAQPSEFVARMQAVRYMLAKKGIYDATREEFTEQHFNKMMADPAVKADTHLEDLLKVIKGTGREQMRNFVELMNTIAKNDKGADKSTYVMTPKEWNKVNKEKKSELETLARDVASGKVKVGRKPLPGRLRHLEVT